MVFRANLLFVTANDSGLTVTCNYESYLKRFSAEFALLGKLCDWIIIESKYKKYSCTGTADENMK